MLSSGIDRLKEELIQEKNKTNELQDHVDYLKRKVVDLECILYSVLPSVNKGNNKANYTPEDPTTHSSIPDIDLENSYLINNCLISIDNFTDDPGDINDRTIKSNYNINDICSNNKSKANEGRAVARTLIGGRGCIFTYS